LLTLLDEQGKLEWAKAFWDGSLVPAKKGEARSASVGDVLPGSTDLPKRPKNVVRGASGVSFTLVPIYELASRKR
jgi:hypothetical protein